MKVILFKNIKPPDIYILNLDCYIGNQEESLIYGGGGVDGSENWLCDKCIWKITKGKNSSKPEPTCCLCLLRGGALKQTDDKQKWAHLTCALCIDGVYFKNQNIRSAIHVPNNLFKKEIKQNFKCLYCSSFTKEQASICFGLTVKCQMPDCTNRFHVSCGLVYGKCLFDHGDWPDMIWILCHEHAEKNKIEACELKNKKCLPFKIGTLVQIDNQNFKIVHLEEQLFYEVDFSDGTFSNDMLPEDIVVKSILNLFLNKLFIKFSNLIIKN